MLNELGLLVFALTAMLGTPGPAAVSLAAVGATAGFRKGIPFLAGILCGGAVVIVASALGVSALLAMFPAIKRVLQICAFAYFLYLAWRIYRSGVGGTDQKDFGEAPSFAYGLFFNLINPKSYAVFAAIFTSFSISAPTALLSAIVTGGVSFVFLIIIDCLWMRLGTSLQASTRHPVWGGVVRTAFSLGVILAACFSILRL